MQKNLDLTEGRIGKNLILFAVPLMIGNLLQQLYNIVDTLIVGKYLGEHALAAVGSAYSLMIFLTSILCGLCMGSGVFFSIQWGKKRTDLLRQGVFISFVSIFIATIGLNILVYLILDVLIRFMRIPQEIMADYRQYLTIIFLGILATFLYNFFANLLRAVGNSVIPLLFLGVSTMTNIVLDLVFILRFQWGVLGAAAATVIAQYLAGVGIMLYAVFFCRELRPGPEDRVWDGSIFREIAHFSTTTCVQQSVMNFGILLVQGLVNSFGTVVMAAFAAGVKIDTLAYSPVQDFGNAFSTFIAQNHGAGRLDRIRQGIKTAVLMVTVFCLAVSAVVFCFAEGLMGIFVDGELKEVIQTGVGYLRVEGACYIGIGILFLLYGFYRAVERPGMSVVLTVISLGTRVALAYALSAIPGIGVWGIWAAIPIGWALADVTGIVYGRRCFRGGTNSTD